jgi:hypothetical protein
MTVEQITVPELFEAKARGVSITVRPQDMPEASLNRIFAYGLQRIVNDACAGAKDDEEATSLANKKLENLYAGLLRASGTREGDPIKAEALRIALVKVKASPKVKAWVVENGLKTGDKEAVAKFKELALDLASREDIVEQAKANVSGVRDLEIDIEL